MSGKSFLLLGKYPDMYSKNVFNRFSKSLSVVCTGFMNHQYDIDDMFVHPVQNESCDTILQSIIDRANIIIEKGNNVPKNVSIVVDMCYTSLYESNVLKECLINRAKYEFMPIYVISNRSLDILPLYDYFVFGFENDDKIIYDNYLLCNDIIPLQSFQNIILSLEMDEYIMYDKENNQLSKYTKGSIYIITCHYS